MSKISLPDFFRYFDETNTNGGGSFRRSLCVDYLYYNDDCSMKRVIQTSEGVNRVE